MRFPIDTIADNLMLPVEEMRANNVEEQTIRRILRLRDIYNFMLRNPLKKDREYIDYIERETGTPITIVSVGPDRAQTIERQIG